MTDLATAAPERLDLNSMDVAAERVERLREDFPEVFREGRIDFDALKRSLSEWVDPGKERFGLTWPGKAACMRVIQQPSAGTLVPDRAESVDFDTTQNVIIEGENLEVLKLLQRSYYGKVKMIYIDPPYNTGREFIYPDNYRDGLKEYLRYSGQADGNGTKLSTNTESEGRYHSNWLNMMYPRLYLARNLLRDDGAIFVTTDDHEVQNLRAVMNEVFGEENFVAQIEWQKRYTRSNNTDNFTSVIDHICVYQRSDEFKVSLLPRDEDADARFTNPDNDPRGPWKATPFLNQVAPERRPNLVYAIANPNTGQVTIPSTKAWRYEKAVYERLADDGRLYWGAGGIRPVPDIKTFLSEVRQGMTPINFWPHEYAGNTDQANREIKELFGEKIFDTPKPTRLIERMFEHCPGNDWIVIDFFAGSGSTAHAVMKANASDGGERRFVLVQLPEPIEAGGGEDSSNSLSDIADLCRERVRRAGKAIAAERSGKLDLNGHGPLDIGFRAYRLTESNFLPWNGGNSGDTSVERQAALFSERSVEQQIAIFADNVLPHRTSEDILTEILLKSGYELTVPVERLELAGKEVFSVAGGDLLVSLDRSLTIEVIEAMAARDPAQIICLDVGFGGNDALKVNAVQTIKGRGNTVFKVV